MNEHSLHSAIKDWYSRAGDRVEVKVDGFIIDIVRENLLIEIQTRNFSAIKKKMESLARTHSIRLVHPIAKQKWIVRTTDSGEFISRRRSPRKGRVIDVFRELVSFPHLVTRKNFSVEVLMTMEEEVRCDDRRGSWRRKGFSVKDRKLVDVAERTLFRSERDFLRFLPHNSKEPFTNRKLAKQIGIPVYLARKATYCLGKMGLIERVGKVGRALTFKTSEVYSSTSRKSCVTQANSCACLMRQQ